MDQQIEPRRSSREARPVRMGYNPYICSPCGCEDTCQSACDNRKGLIQCVTGENCSYESCSNRPFGQGTLRVSASYMELYHTGDGRGQGVRLARSSESDQFIGEYKGKPIRSNFKPKKVSILWVFCAVSNKLISTFSS